MRLFHVSEESDIKVFEPRIPTREDLDQNKGLVWAINETCSHHISLMITINN